MTNQGPQERPGFVPTLERGNDQIHIDGSNKWYPVIPFPCAGAGLLIVNPLQFHEKLSRYFAFSTGNGIK